MDQTDLLAPFRLPLDDFLSGGEDRGIDIDVVVGTGFDSVLNSYPADSIRIGRSAASLAAKGYRHCELTAGDDAGIGLLHGPTLVGLYIGGALAVHPAHQGKGLGSETVFTLIVTFGSLPTWSLDIAAYSPAGVAAHVRAWHLARDFAYVTRKVATLGAWRIPGIQSKMPYGQEILRHSEELGLLPQ